MFIWRNGEKQYFRAWNGCSEFVRILQYFGLHLFNVQAEFCCHVSFSLERCHHVMIHFFSCHWVSHILFRSMKKWSQQCETFYFCMLYKVFLSKLYRKVSVLYTYKRKHFGVILLYFSSRIMHLQDIFSRKVSILCSNIW